MHRRRYSEEEKTYLHKIIPGRCYKEIAELFNDKFVLPITTQQVKSFVGNNKLNTGRTGRFEKGHETHNKGKKKWWTGGEETQFKKGRIPINHRPIGSVRFDKDGYMLVKVGEPNKWRHKANVVWEESNGTIPKGHVIIFGDGDKSNINIDNLILVSRAELLRLNQLKLIGESKEITKIGVSIVKLHNKIAKAEKRKK